MSRAGQQSHEGDWSTGLMGAAGTEVVQSGEEEARERPYGSLQLPGRFVVRWELASVPR